MMGQNPSGGAPLPPFASPEYGGLRGNPVWEIRRAEKRKRENTPYKIKRKADVGRKTDVPLRARVRRTGGVPFRNFDRVAQRGRVVVPCMPAPFLPDSRRVIYRIRMDHGRRFAIQPIVIIRCCMVRHSFEVSPPSETSRYV